MRTISRLGQLINVVFTWSAVNRPLSTIVVLTLMTAAVLFVSRFGPTPYGDGEYHEGTKDIVELIYGSSPDRRVRLDKGFFPVIYYLPAYLLAGPGARDETLYLAGVVWNLFSGVVAIFWIAAKVRKRWSRYSAGAFIALTFAFPIHIYYAKGILAEPLALLAISMLFSGWESWKDSGFLQPMRCGGWWLWATGLLVLVGTRLNLAPLLIILAVLAILAWKQVDSGAHLTSGLLAAVLLVCAAVAGLGALSRALDPQSVDYKRNQLQLSLVIGRYEFRDEPLNWLFWSKSVRADSIDYQNYRRTVQSLRERCGDAQPHCSEIFFRWALQDVLSHPWLTARQFLIKVAQSQAFLASGVIAKGESTLSQSTGFAAAFITAHIWINLINLFVFGLWVVFLLRNRDWIADWPLWAVWLAGLPYLWLLHSEPRYMFPARALMVVAASVAIAHRFWTSSEDPPERDT